MRTEHYAELSIRSFTQFVPFRFLLPYACAKYGVHFRQYCHHWAPELPRQHCTRTMYTLVVAIAWRNLEHHRRYCVRTPESSTAVGTKSDGVMHVGPVGRPARDAADELKDLASYGPSVSPTRTWTYRPVDRPSVCGTRIHCCSRWRQPWLGSLPCESVGATLAQSTRHEEREEIQRLTRRQRSGEMAERAELESSCPSPRRTDGLTAYRGSHTRCDAITQRNKSCSNLVPPAMRRADADQSSVQCGTPWWHKQEIIWPRASFDGRALDGVTERVQAVRMRSIFIRRYRKVFSFWRRKLWVTSSVR